MNGNEIWKPNFSLYFSSKINRKFVHLRKIRSCWLNCALPGDEAVYWVSLGQQWLVLGDTDAVIDIIWSVEGIGAFIY